MPDLPKNLKCPNCAAKHLFRLEIIASAEVSETQLGNITDITWGPNSAIVCKSCYKMGTVAEFTMKRSKKELVNE